MTRTSGRCRPPANNQTTPRGRASAASDEFKVLARVPLGEKSYTTPAVADGVMYLRTLSHLFSLGGK